MFCARDAMQKNKLRMCKRTLDFLSCLTDEHSARLKYVYNSMLHSPTIFWLSFAFFGRVLRRYNLHTLTSIPTKCTVQCLISLVNELPMGSACT